MLPTGGINTSGINQSRLVAPGDGGFDKHNSSGVVATGGLQSEIPALPANDRPVDAAIAGRHARIAYNPRRIMVEYIEGLAVTVQPSVGCPICFTESEGGLDNLTIKAYAPANENCQNNWHSFCRDCLHSTMMACRPAECPLCRSSFGGIEPLQGWNKQLDVKKQLYFQPELLSCPGCNDDMLRADIRNHLVNCEENKAAVNQNEARYRESYLDYLKQHDGSTGAVMGKDAGDRPVVMLYKIDGEGKFQKQAASEFLEQNPHVTKPLHDISIGGEHQVFLASPGEQTPVAGVIQFETINNSAEHGADFLPSSLQLRELPSVTSLFRPANRNDIAALKSIPDSYQALLTENLSRASGTSRFHDASFTHAFTALQHTNAPVALSFRVSKPAMDGFDQFSSNYQQVKATYLMYGIKIPGAEAYWGIQKIDPDKRIVLEASKHYQLIGLDSMTRKEEAEVQKATGRSVRENRSNSIKYTLILSTVMKEEKGRRRDNHDGFFWGVVTSDTHLAGSIPRLGGGRGRVGKDSDSGSDDEIEAFMDCVERVEVCSDGVGTDSQGAVAKKTHRHSRFARYEDSDSDSDVVGMDVFRDGVKTDSQGAVAKKTHRHSRFARDENSDSDSDVVEMGALRGGGYTDSQGAAATKTPKYSRSARDEDSDSDCDVVVMDMFRDDVKIDLQDPVAKKTRKYSPSARDKFACPISASGGRRLSFGVPMSATGSASSGSLFGAEPCKGFQFFGSASSSGDSVLVKGGKPFADKVHSMPDEGVPQHQAHSESAGGVQDITTEDGDRYARRSTHSQSMPPELKQALAFKSDATIKSLSEQTVPTAYRNGKNVEAVRSLPPTSLVPRMVTFIDVDILRTPCPVSDKNPPVGVLLEAAVQQMHILKDQS